MNERRVTVGLELHALRTENVFRANLISRMADLLALKPDERDALSELERLHLEVSAWAAAQGMPAQFLTPPAGSPPSP